VICLGADAGIIRLGFEGASRLELDEAGNLVLHTPRGPVIERALVIDPVLSYSTYLGGTDDNLRSTGGNGIAVDASGNAYVVGTTFSNNFPTVNASRRRTAVRDQVRVAGRGQELDRADDRR
jgi:hypothetical protein